MKYTKGECGCRVSISGTIFYCPLHKSAPDLYEALNVLRNWGGYGQVPMVIRNQIYKALAKVTGGE